MKSLVGVIEKVTSDEGKRRKVWKRVLEWGYATPSSYLDEVYTKYTTDEEKTHALADVYVNSRPESSWQHLVQTLYGEGELVAAKEAKSFLQQYGKQHLQIKAEVLGQTSWLCEPLNLIHNTIIIG